MRERAVRSRAFTQKNSMPDAPSTISQSWLRSAFRLLIVVLVVVLFAGFLYENISETRERRFHPMPGQLVDIGGYKLHIDCTGQGSPTVILDAGMGDSFLSWHKVQPEIAKFTRVCSYDRAGLGYSDSSPRPRTSRVFVDELHRLLQHASITGPLVLVGHSMGGFDVRLYASLYRNEVIGLVLVDSSHPEQQKRLPPAINDLDATWLREQEFFEFTMPFGIPRLMGFCGNDDAVRAADCNFHTARESVEELKAISQSAAANCEQRLTRRHPSRGALARSRYPPARPSRRPGQTHQRCLATDAGRISAPLHQRQAGDREKQRPLHPARSPRPGGRRGSQRC